MSTTAAPTADDRTTQPSPTETDEQLARRLQSEAEFQNSRVRNEEGEARDRFYYLVEDAFTAYHASLQDVEGKDVLIVGCSEGGVTPMARKGARAVGIDIADEAIARLNEAIDREGLRANGNALVMNAEELTFEDESFDLIVCTGVLHHLDVEAAAKSWSRCLKPGGKVHMLEPMAFNPAIALYRFLTPSMRTPDEHPLRPRDLRILRKYFGEIEMDCWAMTTVVSLLFAYLPDVFGMKRRLMRLLDPVDQFCFRYLPFTRYMAWTAFLRCGKPK